MIFFWQDRLTGHKVDLEKCLILKMSGLEDVGIPGSDHLREALTNCTDPLAAIEEFQVTSHIVYDILLWCMPISVSGHLGLPVSLDVDC